MEIVLAKANENQVLLKKILALYVAMDDAAGVNDFNAGLRILGTLQDTEEQAMNAGLTRQQITEYVNAAFDTEVKGDAA